MNKLNKKTIAYIVISIIFVIAIHYFITKEDYIESNSNLYITETNDVNNNTEDNSSNTKENIKENIVVYITGAVRNAGVYEIEENSRIANVIEKAGGLTEEANIENINLAYILEDGMKIHIPKKGEDSNEIKNDIKSYEFITNSIPENLKNKNIDNKNEKININKATQTELETLPGIGPSIALKIIEYRKENGKFKSIDDIKKVSGIGENKFSQIKNLIEL